MWRQGACRHQQYTGAAPSRSAASDSVTPRTAAHWAPVHGILWARILEWAAMPSSRGIFPTQGSSPANELVF